MKHTPGARLAIRIALFYCTFTGLCQGIQGQAEIPFRLVRDTIIMVPMMANGQGPFEFVLDTGADTTIVDTSLAARLSLRARKTVQQTTLAGARSLMVGLLDTLAAGPAQIEDFPALVQDLAELRKLDPEIKGIAGQDFLSHFNYLLNYPGHSIRIEATNEIQEAIVGDPVPMGTIGNRMLVASEAESQGRVRIRLLLDSGANAVVLMPRASQALELVAKQNGLEITCSGRVGLHVGRLQELKVGNQQFQNIAVAVSAAAPAERIGDGLFPTKLFKLLYVNNRQGFVIFNPRPRKN